MKNVQRDYQNYEIFCSCYPEVFSEIESIVKAVHVVLYHAFDSMIVMPNFFCVSRISFVQAS